MKRIFLTTLFLGLALKSRPCVTCNKQLRNAIFSSTFYPNLVLMLSAFFVLGILVAILTWMATRRHHRQTQRGKQAPSPVPTGAAGTVLGIGVGGFIDGIVLHQLLQWHQMLTAKIPADTVIAKSVNMFWDGIFHSFTLLTTMLGVYLLWRVGMIKSTNRSGRLLTGGMLAGWGLFNVVEGIIDHLMLRLHNVRELSPDPALWNYGFLALGLIQLVAGFCLMTVAARSRQHTAAPVTEP